MLKKHLKEVVQVVGEEGVLSIETRLSLTDSDPIVEFKKINLLDFTKKEVAQVVGEEGVYECAICGAQFPGINMLGQHCQVFSLYNFIDIQLFTNNCNG